MSAPFRYLSTPDGLTASQERYLADLTAHAKAAEARMRLLEARLAEVVELCDETMAHDALVYDGTILKIHEAASGEEA